MVAPVAENKRINKRENRKSKIRLTEAQVVLGWLVVLALIALLGAIYLFQTSRIASTGRMVQELQIEMNDIKRTNSELERDIAEAQSLKRLQKDAQEFGFIKARPENVDYLIVTDYPQENEMSPEEESSQRPEPLDDFRSAFIKFVIGKVDDLVRGESP
jgi:cell division protein FtsL